MACWLLIVRPTPTTMKYRRCISPCSFSANQIHWTGRFSWDERINRGVFDKAYIFTRYPIVSVDLLGGIKGIGPNAIDTIIRIREEGGPFKDIFDLLERVPLNVLNRKGLECMAYAGAFDGFAEMSRAQFFVPSENVPNENYLDELIRYANKFHNDAINQGSSLFGDVEELKPVRPEMWWACI